VRDRPLEQQQAADEKHKKFDDEKSEFMGYLKLWQWIEEGRGQHGHGAQAGQKTDSHKLSNRQQEARLRESFVNPRRVREWRDIHSQLHTVVAEHGWRLNQSPATYEQIHMAMLAGLLGNVGCKSDDEDWYLGARGIKFWRHPGAHLSKKPGRWIVAAELVETTRLFGRGLAAIEPQWLERSAATCSRSSCWSRTGRRRPPRSSRWSAPRSTASWSTTSAVNFGRVDPGRARDLHPRGAGQRRVGQPPALPRPQPQADRPGGGAGAQVAPPGRAGGRGADPRLLRPAGAAEVVSGATFERWYREASRDNPKLLMLSREELMRHEAAGITTSAFPRTVRLGGVDCAASYLHQPGDPRTA
jgi:ATP-dependent helicase HrpA